MGGGGSSGGERGLVRVVFNRKGWECVRGCRKFLVLEGGSIGDIGVSLGFGVVAIGGFAINAGEMLLL